MGVNLAIPQYLNQMASAEAGAVQCFEAERLELLGVVVGEQPIPDMASQVVDRGVVERTHGRILDGRTIRSAWIL